MTRHAGPRRRVLLFPEVAVLGRRRVRLMLLQQLVSLTVIVIYAGLTTSDVVRWLLVAAIVIGVVATGATARELIGARGSRSAPDASADCSDGQA